MAKGCALFSNGARQALEAPGSFPSAQARGSQELSMHTFGWARLARVLLGECWPHVKASKMRSSVCQQGICFSPMPHPLVFLMRKLGTKEARRTIRVTQLANAETRTQVLQMPLSPSPKEPSALDCRGARGGGCLGSGLQASRPSRAEETTAAHRRTLLMGL